jgi:hypothetical protein
MMMRTKRQSGQATILGVVTLLLLSLSLFATFNIGQSVHERIRVQQEADVQAYAMANEVARTYNYFAVTNRAIISAYVGIQALHAYESLISSTSNIYWSAAFNYFEVAGIEGAHCDDWDIPCCFHAIIAIIDAIEFIAQASDQSDDVQALDPLFVRAVEGFEYMIEMIHIQQLFMELLMMFGIGGPRYLGEGVAELHDLNAKAAGTDGGVWLLNMINFIQTFDGDADHKAYLTAEVANASRSDWVVQRPPQAYMVNMLPLFLEKLPGVSDDCSLYLGLGDPFLSGTAVVKQKGEYDGPSHSGNKAQGIDSADAGILIQIGCFDDVPPVAFPFPFIISWPPGEIYTPRDGGGNYFHDAGNCCGSPHQGGTQHKMDVGCLSDASCIMKFKVDDSASSDFGQPSFFSYVKQDLRVNFNGTRVGQGSFEIADNGIEVGLGSAGTAKLNLHNDKEGRGLAKAMTYYHRFRNGDGGKGWKEQPNWFHPYWRAKLHPFKITDYLMAAIFAGDSEGMEAGLGMMSSFLDFPAIRSW